MSPTSRSWPTTVQRRTSSECKDARTRPWAPTLCVNHAHAASVSGLPSLFFSAGWHFGGPFACIAVYDGWFMEVGLSWKSKVPTRPYVFFVPHTKIAFHELHRSTGCP